MEKRNVFVVQRIAGYNVYGGVELGEIEGIFNTMAAAKFYCDIVHLDFESDRPLAMISKIKVLTTKDLEDY